MEEVVGAIADNSIPRSLTYACRLFLDDAGQVSFMATAQSLGTRMQADETLRKLAGNHPPASSTVANFQDASVAPETDRYALMEYYYGINLDRLIDLKIQYDPANVFQSGMSIPNKKR